MAEEKRNKKLIFQFVMLMLLLAVTPIGTYFWMKEGVDYRAKRLAELEDFGKVGNFSATDLKGEPFDTANIRNKMALVIFLSETQQEAKSVVERIELVEHQMEEQLDQRKDMLFLFYTTAGNLDAYSKNLITQENDKFVFVQVDASELQRLKKEVYKLPYGANSEGMTDPLALVDLGGTIRHYYNPMSNTDMGKLVEHMAMILPQDKDKDIVFRRESEK